MYNGKEETVRYLLVDTPESKKPGTCVQPYAESAYNRNKQLVNSGKLTLEFDDGNKEDKYGRLLAYLFVDGKSVQEALLKEGYARVAYIYEPDYKYLDQFQADEQYAKDKDAHIWSKSGYVTDSGFNGCASGLTTTSKSKSPSPAVSGATNNYTSKNPKSTSEFFANCTDLRKTYSNGVPEGHPAYQSKMDRDKDHYACESC